MSNNPFWQYSITVYQRPVVADLCLKLQDEYQADVNMLLCSAWLSSIGQPLTDDLLNTLLLESQEWQESCLAPLRQVRRFLKTRSPADIYQKMKQLELQLESIQQERLYQCLKHLPLAAANNDLLKRNIQTYLQTLANLKQEPLGQLALSLCEAIQTQTELLE